MFSLWHTITLHNTKSLWNNKATSISSSSAARKERKRHILYWLLTMLDSLSTYTTSWQHKHINMQQEFFKKYPRKRYRVEEISTNLIMKNKLDINVYEKNNNKNKTFIFEWNLWRFFAARDIKTLYFYFYKSNKKS